MNNIDFQSLQRFCLLRHLQIGVFCKLLQKKLFYFKLLLHPHFLNWRQKQICLHYQKFFWCTNKQISRFTTLGEYLTFKGKISDKPPEKSGAVDNFQIMSDLTFLFIWHENSKQTTDLSIFEIFTWLGWYLAGIKTKCH